VKLIDAEAVVDVEPMPVTMYPDQFELMSRPAAVAVEAAIAAEIAIVNAAILLRTPRSEPDKGKPKLRTTA
jgi:hypothetical protein